MAPQRSILLQHTQMANMRAFTLEEFGSNLSRARSLVSAYELSRDAGRGRRSVSTSDVLRAATVFLHSSLEEVIRNLFRWKLPDAPGDALNDVPLVGLSPTHRPTAFLLGKLAPHRGRFVDNVIRESIDEYVNHFNVNNTTELSRCLVLIGLEPAPFSPYFPLVASMMQRRHQIVHQMDRNEAVGAGHHRAHSISVLQVERWAGNLEALVQAIVDAVPD